MIELPVIEAVVAQYERFGWKLERILLKDPSEHITAAFPGASIIRSSQDALWFSRKSGNGLAWELRRLSGTPFALVRVIAADSTDAARDAILEAVQVEMQDRDVKADGVISNGK